MFDPDEMMDRLMDMLQSTFGKVKESNDPNDYDRHIKIEGSNSESLLLTIEEVNYKYKVYDRKRAEAAVARSEANAAKGRLFLRLDDKYPEIRSANPGSRPASVSWRYFQGAYYYVADDQTDDNNTTDKK